MALRLSTGLRNAMLGEIGSIRAMVGGDDIALVDGGAGEDTITRTAADFVTAGFQVGQAISVRGATDSADDVTAAILTAVAAGTLTMATATWTTAQGAGTDIAVAAVDGGSLKDMLQGGIIHIYSGSQPADADAAETGTKLVEITTASGTMTPGTLANGLVFGASASGAVAKSTDVWSGVAVATGTAGWFRFYSNAETTGLSTVAIRFDGTVGTSGQELILSSTSITSGATHTVDSFSITLPANA